MNATRALNYAERDRVHYISDFVCVIIEYALTWLVTKKRIKQITCYVIVNDEDSAICICSIGIFGHETEEYQIMLSEMDFFVHDPEDISIILASCVIAEFQELYNLQ